MRFTQALALLEQTILCGAERVVTVNCEPVDPDRGVVTSLHQAGKLTCGCPSLSSHGNLPVSRMPPLLAKPTPENPGPTVLIVEDQRLVAADLAMQLRSFGYRVVGFATSGAEAISKARELDPHVVLMDIHLEGEMDGTEAARTIRASSRCAIVFLTAFSDVATLERAKLAEPGGYVVKPASPVELRCAVEVALYKQLSESRRSEDEARGFTVQLDSVRGRVAELESAYRELESFSASMTHDLRNPLQVIAGAAEMLERTQAEQMTAVGRVFLGQVGAAADRMMERLTSLLDLARANRAELTLSHFDLAALAGEIWEELRGELPRGCCVISPSLPVQADRGLLRRVLENLLSNAVKFSSRQDQPVIEIGRADDGTKPCYFVRDHGIGFAMSEAEGRLFTPYGRLHERAEFAGTGLGLAGARRIIERHGGEMWAYSVEGQGATFFFSLPPVPA
ncbi:MAG: response regulator receiver sensor signal transduction histidine kinase [Myxococcaceae bacterium]|nr:response regulator receiver sensor signal transduction histidine kinase [Myxococcaceae bacterium]